ncbi:MAG: AAA domain-containing protein [Pseudomonadota bacterium]
MNSSDEISDAAPLSQEQRSLSQLIDYVRVLIEMADKPVWSVSSYNNLVLTEQDLRNRIGIRHDIKDAEGAVYLKIDRLRRTDPPEPHPEAKDWLTVGRDPYKEPLVETLRTSVISATEAAKLVAAGTVDPTDLSKTLKPKPGEDLCDVIFRLDRFPDAKAKVETYVTQTWPQWAQAEKPRRETIDIYERVFSLQQALKLEGSERPLEVVWGMGVARWKLPPNELDHPLIEQLVELELDESGAILVRPRSLDPFIALKPYTAMENPGVDLVARFAREHFSGSVIEDDFSPFVKDTYTPVLRYACAQFDKSGRYHPDVVPPDDRSVPPAGPNLIITDTWALYARPRSENFFTADLIRLKEAVEAAETLPPPAVALVTAPSDEMTYTTSFGAFSTGGMAASGGYEQSTSGKEQLSQSQFFFPKAFNEEQIAIVQRLEDSDVEGVVVQGPPGTGKTHTIANIICHYLATGRRVLVTSKSEGALAVLRDQIPEGIRDLVISLLTSEREGLKQLETTVNVLASRIASLDTRSTERDVRDSEGRIVELQNRITKIDAEMRAFADKHLRRVGATKDTDGILPIELAERIVRERDRYDWFVDRPAFSEAGKPQFGPEEVHAARTARRALGSDLDYIGADLPSTSDLPDPAAIGAVHQDLANAARIERDRNANAPVMSSSEADALARAGALLSAVEALAAVQGSCAAHKWLGTILIEWRRSGMDAESVRPLATLFAEMREVIRQRTQITSYGVSVPEGAYAIPEFVSAVERACAGQKPFGLIGWGQSELRAAFKSIRILGVPAQSAVQWKAVLDVLVWQRNMSGTLARWRALCAEFSLPDVPLGFNEAARALQTHAENVSLIAEAIRLHIPVVLTESPRLFPFGLNAVEVTKSEKTALEAADAIRSEISRHRLLITRAKLNDTKAKLEPCSGRISRRLKEFLSTDVGSPDFSPNAISDNWRELLAELDRVRGMRTLLETVSNVSDLVSQSGAPKWGNALRTTPVTGVNDPWTPEDWQGAWVWAQADTHLRAIDGRARLRELDKQRLAADDEIHRLFQSVVRLRTLLTLKSRITRKIDAALQMFLTAIRKIGKGTGKSASRLRRDARDAMESSYAAVPCWIMPSWRISESLPSTLASFDLVIIDEASQSDISALPAVLRAKKVLVVGDDKQVSPTAAFIEEQKIRSLRMHYLDGQHFGALMLPGNSLYELALACFPGRRIMLREHFRCVEPIIRFSFQFYTEEIVPVRLPKASERLSPPLIDVHVTNGQKDKSNRNFAEAEAIVDEIAKIVADPAMANRSIGVISLIGAKQAALIQSLLLKRIGEEAYVRHDIACGDSAIFQGKERDIVLLSMVECPQTRTSKTALALQQRFNVALSRARDRQYLFRSVTEEMLKPDDLKAKVLRHFKSPMAGRSQPTGDLLALCDSGFERDVLTRLIKLGYRVQPQVSVGPYSIDLVVEGREDRRLAVELDGDKYHGPEKWAEDLARQRVMERVGWRFWRCWGSSYRIDPEGCIDDLIGSLSSLGIEPIGNDRQPNVWTEFRKYPLTKDETEDGDRPGGDACDGQPEAYSELPTEVAVVVEVGSRVQVQVSDDNRVRVLTLSADRHDPSLGIISVRHPSGAALLGAEEDDEVEFEIDGKVHKWMVLHIEKKGQHQYA